MDIHHDTSFRSILEDDSIFLASKTCIRSCSGKGAGLWLIVKPSICFLHYYFIFTSTLHFRLSLIQPLAYSLFTCECGHDLNASNTHLARCLFRGQRISTHDFIRNVMYALIQKIRHAIWREWWYTLMPKVSLLINLYMIHED
jgi:hypothetical protein